MARRFRSSNRSSRARKNYVWAFANFNGQLAADTDLEVPALLGPDWTGIGGGSRDTAVIQRVLGQIAWTPTVQELCANHTPNSTQTIALAAWLIHGTSEPAPNLFSPSEVGPEDVFGYQVQGASNYTGAETPTPGANGRPKDWQVFSWDLSIKRRVDTNNELLLLFNNATECVIQAETDAITLFAWTKVLVRID